MEQILEAGNNLQECWNNRIEGIRVDDLQLIGKTAPRENQKLQTISDVLKEDKQESTGEKRGDSCIPFNLILIHFKSTQLDKLGQLQLIKFLTAPNTTN